jgi:dimethylamine/trimethylamine dehydrogenase
VQRRLLETEVAIARGRALEAIGPGTLATSCVHTGTVSEMAADAVVLVTARLPDDALYLALRERSGDFVTAGIRSVRCAAATPGRRPPSPTQSTPGAGTPRNLTRRAAR